jgi:sugar phosphate isomerase/epimerase
MRNKTVNVLLFLTMIFASSYSSEKDLSLLKIGICTNYTNGLIMKPSGYSYIEESVGRFLMPKKDEAEFKNMLEDLTDFPLPVKACNGFIPKDLKSVGPESSQVDILEYMETTFRRAEKVGVEIIVFGSGGSRSIPEGFSREEALKQFVTLCMNMAPIAEKYNVVVVLEPLNIKECNFINSVAEGGEIVKKVNHPNFQLLADIYHMKMDGEDPENIVEYGQFIKHIHIAEKEDRAVPGTYNEDFSSYFSALKEINYQGMISIEARWEDMEKQAPLGIKIIKQQLKQIK